MIRCNLAHAPRCPVRGFTLVEVMIATALLGIVGLAILAFLSAFAGGASARARVSDPALEGTLAIERLKALAPAIRCTLAFDGDEAAIWLSDAVPSRTVHLSELGWLRFDRTTGDLLLERIDPAAIAADRSLESEFRQTDDLIGLRNEVGRAGLLRSQVLAEGLDAVEFEAARDGAAAGIRFFAAHASATIALPPAIPEEPFR